MNPIEIARMLAADVDKLSFNPPVTHVYNPLQYACKTHESYLRRYGQGTKEVVLLGMNPGPWGMVQTGVPFGEVAAVRDWLGIKGPVVGPKDQHSARPVTGFDCARREVSGARLWGWARELFVTPERFFKRFFVANYCPLAFLEQSGRNYTPDHLPAGERERLHSLCDLALRRTVECLKPRYVVGVGVFAQKRAMAALEGVDVSVGRMPHPSPASPLANRGWAAQATAQLTELGIKLPTT